MSWLSMWSWFKRPAASNRTDPEPKPNKNNRDRVYANNGNTSSQTISKERDLISRTKINETKQLLLSIKDLATTLESLPLDDLLAKTEPQPIKTDSDTTDKSVDANNNVAVPSTVTELAEEALSEEDAISDQVSQESETLTIGSDESPESDHSSQSSTSKSPGRGLVRGTGVSVSQHGDMIWDERRGWVSRTGHEDVLQVDLLDTHAPATPPLSADLPQDFVLTLNTDRLAHEHAQLGAWMHTRTSTETDRSYLHLIRTMSIMKMVREVETVRRMMSDSDSDEDEGRVKARVNNVSQNGATSGDKPASRVMSDKLRQFVDEREEDDDIVLPDKPLKLVQQSPVPESAFPSELTVELDTKTSNAPSAAKTKSGSSTKRGKGLKLVPAQATFSDELVFDDEPKSSTASNTSSARGQKDLSAFVDADEDEQPVQSVKSKPSKMKLITLDSLPSVHKKKGVAALPSLASAAVQSVRDKQDEELFDDIELPSAADLKRRIKALRPNTNNTSAGLLMKRHSSGKIDSGALEDWCEDEDDDAPLNSASKKSAVNDKTRGGNLLTVK